MGPVHKVEEGWPYTQGGTLVDTNTVGADPGVDGFVRVEVLRPCQQLRS